MRRATLIERLILASIAGLAAPLTGQSPNGPPNPLLEKLTHPLAELRTLDSRFPFSPPLAARDEGSDPSLIRWEKRRDALRRHVQISLGLWPMPRKTPLNPVVHGRLDMEDYTVERVFFESFPGFHVTGNLYRPKGVNGRVPAVLSPHGHFADGRFHWASDEAVANEIAAGAEDFESNARSPLQTRCIHLARMGCVVFHYDMIGYADSRQISHELAHGFHARRPDMNSPQAWGFFSPQAELRLQSIMGLQSWNSIRALDFLCSLPDVDAQRIGVTGASGGGTQTFILCAIDPRPAAAFPAVMVSTAMQGGCTCENCCNLRIDTGNIELAALVAPRPLGLTAANDWTREMETRGFPELQSLYRLYYPIAPRMPLELTARLEFGHNFNQPSREAMYRFMNEHLKLGIDPQSLAETPVTLLTPDKLSVFNEAHPPRAGGRAFESRLLRDWEMLGKIDALDDRPLYDDSFLELQRTVRTGLESLVGHSGNLPRWTWNDEPDAIAGNWKIRFGKLTSDDGRMETRVAIAENSAALQESADSEIVVELNAAGIERFLIDDDGPFSDGGQPTAAESVRVGIDWLPGLDNGTGVPGNRLVDNGREAAGYTYGYNRSLFSWRVSQLLDLIDELRIQFPDRQIRIDADRGSAPMAIVARALSDHVVNLRCRLDGFRFSQVDDLRDAMFFPGAVKFGDIDAFAAIRLDGHLEIAGESAETMPLTHAAGQLGRGGDPPVSFEIR